MCFYYIHILTRVPFSLLEVITSVVTWLHQFKLDRKVGWIIVHRKTDPTLRNCVVLLNIYNLSLCSLSSLWFIPKSLANKQIPCSQHWSHCHFPLTDAGAVSRWACQHWHGLAGGPTRPTSTDIIHPTPQNLLPNSLHHSNKTHIAALNQGM